MSPPVSYPIRAAGPADIDAIIALRTEAEGWLREQGIQQWTDDYHDYARDVLRASVESGNAWVTEAVGRVVATISFGEPDLDFWRPDDDLGSALYPSKLIVARSHAHRQLGAAIMDWAGRRAVAGGKQWLRIDVRRDNERLHRYYLSQGWAYVRTVIPPGRRTESGQLFQRAAVVITSTAAEVRNGAKAPPPVPAHSNGGATDRVRRLFPVSPGL